jgi:hypothetical protein
MSLEFDRDHRISIFTVDALDRLEVLTKVLYPADASPSSKCCGAVWVQRDRQAL